MAQAASSIGNESPPAEAILKDEYGLILRCGFAILAAIAEIHAAAAGSRARAVLHGAMVELSILSVSNQSVSDLLNGMRPCFVDNEHHLQGARQVALETAADVVALAAAVEQRLTRGTKMNDTSSRSHCVTVFTLTMLDDAGQVRESRLQFFDMMGSERFVGQNAAHDTAQSSKSTMGGWEGIFANMSLTALMSAVEAAAQARRAKKKGAVIDSVMVGFVLTQLLMGSLTGGALTGMITCVSQAERNGEESYLSLKYGAGMAKLLNAPSVQAKRPLDGALTDARKQLAAVEALLKKGVQGKYMDLRKAQAAQHSHTVAVLEALERGGQ